MSSICYLSTMRTKTTLIYIRSWEHVSGETRCKTCIRCRYLYFKWTSLRQALIETRFFRGNLEEHGISISFVLFGQALLCFRNAICFLTSSSFSKKWLKPLSIEMSILEFHMHFCFVLDRPPRVFRLELVETREERSVKIAYIRSSSGASRVCWRVFCVVALTGC